MSWGCKFFLNFIMIIGFNLLKDIQALLPNFSVKTIVDIGANIGQSAEHFLTEFPTSSIYCIEPVHTTYVVAPDCRRATCSEAERGHQRQGNSTGTALTRPRPLSVRHQQRKCKTHTPFSAVNAALRNSPGLLNKDL